MATQTFEGTWEEIKQHENRLIGHRLRVTVLDEDIDNEAKIVTEPSPNMTPNNSMREAMRYAEELQKDMPKTNGERTQEFLRKARNGGMFGYNPEKGEYE